MEEAWHAAKCGSRWPPSLPVSSPARSLPPPPAMLAPLASSLGAANSMGLDSHKFRHPFIQQINIGDSAIIQEPKIFNTLNLDSCKSGKAELGSSFLSLLSGSAHPASSKFLQLPYSGSELAKFHAREGGIVNGPRCDVPVTSISPISESRGVIENGEDFPFVASRPLSMPTCTNFPLLQNNFQAATSSCHSTQFGKTVPRQAFPGNNAGTKVSSRKHEWPIASSPSNANLQCISNQTTEKMPLEARPSNRSHSSTAFRGRPHVFCMNKVGELFVSDMGLLGVLCFCHKQPMSVAKFCEHSGFPSANPGEAVHLENGMTVAQWRKLCFGVMASDRSNEWEWSDGSSAEVDLVRPKFSSFPTSSKNSASINSFEAFSGLGKIGEPRNKTIFPNHTYGGLRGQTASEKSANKGTENVLQRNGLDRQNLSTKRFVGSSQSTIPALSKNHMAQAIKESTIRMGFEGSHLTLNQGEQNVVPQLVANNISYVGEIGNHPISSPHSGMNNTFSCANHIHRGNFSGQTFVVDQDGSSSNIELRLGHPSQKNNTSPGSFPVAMHPFHLGSVCNLPKAQLHQPLAHTNAADYPKESKRPRLNLQCTLSEESSLNRRLHHSSGSNVFKHSEIEDPMGDATKSSLISFLSHLNTEGNSSSQSTDIIGNYSEYFGARVLDSASLFAKCNFSDFARDLNDGIEKKPDTNGSDLSNNIDQAKGLNIVDNGSYAVVKPNYVVHRKHPPDARVLSSATGGHCIYNSSSVDNRQPTLYFNQPSGMLQTAPNYRNSDKYAEVSLQGNRDRCSCTIHTSTSPIPNATSRHNSENLISFSSTNSMHVSEPISALSNKKSADRTQNLRDESFISLPLRHMDELSKLELPTSSLETNTRCKRLCCLSDVGFLRNVCKDDLAATKELREAPYCIIQQDESSNVVKSAHSFSNCYSCCDVQMSSANADSTGPFKCCNCSASTQRLSYSKEHGIQFSTSHTCHAFEKPCLRLGRISNNSYPDSNKHEVCNHKEESSSVSGKCCCTALPKYLTGCCFSGGDSLSGALSEHLCGKAKTMHVSPTYDRDNMLHDGRRVRLGQCECLRKHVVMKNGCQLALWRDVPNKVRGHSDAAANEKLAQVVQATRLAGDQLTDTAAKEIDGTHQESRSLNEQQISNVSSGSSAAAVTEISIEVNNMVSITTDAGNSKIVCDSMVNEGSRIEKCGSSDEALDNRESEEAINFTDRVKPINSSGNLTNELKLDGSPNFRRPRNQISLGCTDQENISQIHQFEPACRVGKRKGPMKQSRIDVSVPKLGFASLYSNSPEHVSHSLHQPSPQKLDTPHQSDNIMRKMQVYSGRSPTFKRKRSALSSTKPFYLKRFKKHHKVSECDKVQSIYNDHSHRKQKVSAGKKAKQNLARDGKKQFTKEKEKLADAGRPPKFMSLSCIGSSLNHGMDTSCKKVRPVVCSNSGIISSGAGDKQKPAKIVSLRLILKKTSRCSITEHGGKPRLSCISGNNKTSLHAKIGCHNAISTWKLQCENEDSTVVIRNGMDPSNLFSSKIKKISSKNEKCPYELSIMRRDADYGYDEALKSALHHEIAISGSKPRCKETREDEYLDLTESRNQLKISPSTDIGDALVGNEHSTMKSCSKKFLNTSTSANAKLLVISQNGQDHADEPREVNTRRCQSFISDFDAFCCVCGSSNKEDINQLLECSRCLIRVHQACYGISKVPKGRWCCRPCKTNSLNIVCVLCGYGGGAMTRALKSRNIVKSLLKTWKVNPVPSSNGIKSEFSEPGSVGEASEYDGSVHVEESISSEAFPADASETDLTKTVTMSHSDSMPNNFQASNSVTVGILDPSVTQWVHMVCGLWTPGTRCPNVDTMSAFDVSGASLARKITVCSMCNRPGGSCIQCRVMNCSVHFHPWCAHQKGLLQSEIEGDDNENVGFYGRCLLHATPSSSQIHSYPMDTEVDSSKNKDWTCARTEGFKGRKRDEGFNPNHHKPCNDSGGCIVSQEQINAWLHINGQKSCTRRAVKLPSSDIEYDVRKEYIRYKQSKAWKQLVVYKSGIHALGLYTSQFISRGAMVVEYVGEIVGLRIADKREIEYQSGRRLQYKSACYFFRIDKEHIIDATRKGGIARFVNHSCLPNCVAKVISVRNEKKVVFFAERDIYPGEEITYDYHFNHEDEGKKIPCFCNSKNCRRYLN